MREVRGERREEGGDLECRGSEDSEDCFWLVRFREELVNGCSAWFPNIWSCLPGTYRLPPKPHASDARSA